MSVDVDSSEQARRWLRDLVAHQTVSGCRSNLDLLGQVRGFLRERGFDVRLVHSADGQRANLFASLGDARAGGLLLSGHTDVVPVTGQQWTRPPFELTQESGRLYGRGTCDMKGFLSAVLAVIERAPVQSLPTPLHVALTYDEEIGCVGVRQLLSELAGEGIRPGACMVGEPTLMRVVRAHKGRHTWRCKVVGAAAHSSLSGLGVNAAEVACQLVAEVARQAAILRGLNRDEGFYVPYSTMATCRIQSGFANNVIPEEAEFDFDLRYLPNQDPDSAVASIREAAMLLEREMRELVPSARVELGRRTEVPALVDDGGASTLVQRLLVAGLAPGSHVAFTTEGGLYQRSGIPTIVCGPGDIAQAHTVDEFLEDAQLAACERTLEHLLLAPSGASTLSEHSCAPSMMAPP